MQSFPEIFRSQGFSRIRVLKERSTAQVIPSKVKAINNAYRTAR